jgi:hypothetical protein
MERLVELNNSNLKTANQYVWPKMLKNLLVSQKDYLDYHYNTPYEIAWFERLWHLRDSLDREYPFIFPYNVNPKVFFNSYKFEIKYCVEQYNFVNLCRYIYENPEG